MDQEKSKTLTFKEYIALKKELHEKILCFLDDDDEDSQDSFDQLTQIITNQKITQDRNEFKEFLNLIKKIYKNHHRSKEFNSKIIKIIFQYINDIKAYFSNLEIFQLFEKNILILSMLLQKKIIKIDKIVAKYITSTKSNQIYYFLPKIKKYIDTKTYHTIKKDISKNHPDISHKVYKEKYEIGENDSYICELIRDDNVQEFIAYVNKTNYPLNSEIANSIFETNYLFLENIHITLINYAAFYGSIQIIKYMALNNVPLKSSMWIYAIHSNNAELIHYLEENKVKPPDKKEINTGVYMTCTSYQGFIYPYGESIRCHHKNISNYIEDNYLQDKSITQDFFESFILNSYNYEYFPDKINDKNLSYTMLFFNDYCKLVEIFVREKKMKSKDLENRIFILIYFLIMFLREMQGEIIMKLLRFYYQSFTLKLKQICLFHNME